MRDIVAIHGREILDSRGNPTVEVEVTLADGTYGRAAVPSGASTGSMEACELRDGDHLRYKGRGVKLAVENVNLEISSALTGMDASEQVLIDKVLIELDGTENKSRLGANAILAVSLACAKAASSSYNLPLYQYLGGFYSHILPVPMMNILNGGVHADNKIDIQEFMIMPIKATRMTEALQIGSEIFHSLRTILKSKGYSTNTGDEGGFAPDLSNAEQALDFISQAVHDAGYNIGKDVVLALDCAASEFYSGGKYVLSGMGKSFTSEEIVEYYGKLVDSYPIFSIEDPMSEHDHVGWKLITEKLGSKVQLVGDDLFVTNPKLLKDGAKNGLANAILIKPNQIGTLTETLRAIEVAHKSGYKAVLSHRSGETEDTSISHIAVATNCGQIKTGSICRSERVAKYNELIRIEEKLGLAASYLGAALMEKA